MVSAPLDEGADDGLADGPAAQQPDADGRRGLRRAGPAHTSRATRSAYVSRRVTMRARPPSTKATAGRVTPL